jgi:hypothetical protein
MGTITAGSINAALITAGVLNVDRISAGSITATKIYAEAYLGGKRLDHYASGSIYLIRGNNTTITHNLGRYAIVNAWASTTNDSLFVRVFGHTTSSFRIGNGSNTYDFTFGYAYI